jgi:hypothetical protein
VGWVERPDPVPALTAYENVDRPYVRAVGRIPTRQANGSRLKIHPGRVNVKNRHRIQAEAPFIQMCVNACKIPWDQAEVGLFGRNSPVPLIVV